MEFTNFGANRRKLGDLLRLITKREQNVTSVQHMYSSEFQQLLNDARASNIIHKIEHDKHKLIQDVEKHPSVQFYSKKVGECQYSEISRYNDLAPALAYHFGMSKIEFEFQYNENLKYYDKIDVYSGDFEVRMKMYL